MASASTCRAEDGQKRKRPSSPGLPALPCLPHPSLGIPLEGSSTTQTLSVWHAGYHVSSETQGVRGTGGCQEAEMFSVCLGEGFFWEWGGEEHRHLMELGSWFHFFVKSDLSFCAKEGGAQGAGEGKEATLRWHHQADRGWEHESMRSRFVPGKVPFDHSLRRSWLPWCTLVTPTLVNGPEPLARKLTKEVLPLIRVNT